MNVTLQACSGLMLATGAESDPPIGISNSWNDYIGGLHAAVAIVGALSNGARPAKAAISMFRNSRRVSRRSAACFRQRRHAQAARAARQPLEHRRAAGLLSLRR